MSKEGVAIIGHNRAKTIGDNLAENAHPFVEDKTFAMVHNGTLHNHKQIGDTDVDSHALAIVLKKAMDEEDWKKGLEEALSKVKGAYACVWYDQKRDQVCMVRNAERPLFLVKAGSNTLFGSEVGLLTWIATRNNEKVDDIINTKVHTFYTFDMKKTGGDFSETNLTLKSPKTGFDNGTSKHNNGRCLHPRPSKKLPLIRLRRLVSFLWGVRISRYLKANTRGYLERWLVAAFNFLPTTTSYSK